MSDKKISQLSNSGTITGSEEVPVVQSGSTVKTTINAIKMFFDSIYTTTSAVASQITSALSGYVNTSGLTANYIPKASDSDTLANSSIQDNGSGVGVNTAPLANTTFGVVGSDSTSSNHAVKIRSSSANIAEFRNDGAVNINELYITANGGGGTSYWQGGGANRLYIKANTSNSRAEIYTQNGYDLHLVRDGQFIYMGTTIRLATNSIDRLTLDASGNINISGLTASQIVETDASKNLISAAKNSGYNLALGTTAGTVLEGNALANIKDTFMLQSGSAGLNPADATTYYLGLSGIAPNTTATNFAFKIGYDFRIVGCIILSLNVGTSGTTENNTVNFRNITTATSTLISNSVKINSTSTSQINQTVTGLNITGSANDDVCFEWITPTWVTNPTACTLLFRFYIQKLS